MSECFIFNIPSATLRAGPDFKVARGSDGTFTGSLTFTCRKNDIQHTLILQKLRKGTPLLDLYPYGPQKFNFLTVDTWDAEDQPGAYTKVTVQFKGGSPSDEDNDPAFDTEGTKSYSRSLSLQDKSIYTCPAIEAELSAGDIDALRGLRQKDFYIGAQACDYGGYPYGYEVRSYATRRVVLVFLDSANVDYWYNYIVVEGNETYLAPASEWTMSASGIGPIDPSYLDNQGYIDPAPDGDPYTKTGKNWLLQNVQEEIPVLGGVNSYSVTWVEGDWPTKIYARPT